MSATRFLAGTRSAVLADLKANGFVFRDADGVEHIPDVREFAQSGEDWAIWLGKLVSTPAVTDEDGNVTTPAVLTTEFHANVTVCEGMTFATELPEPPTNPHNVFT